MKYFEAEEDLQNLFDEVLNETSIPKWVTFRVLTSDKLKNVCEVKKQSDLAVVLSDVNIAVLINHVVFEQLDIVNQKMVLEEALTSIVVDPDNDKLSIEKADFQTYSGFLAKYGNTPILLLKEVVKSLFDKEAEKERQLKQEKMEKRKNKSIAYDSI